MDIIKELTSKGLSTKIVTLNMLDSASKKLGCPIIFKKGIPMFHYGTYISSGTFDDKNKD